MFADPSVGPNANLGYGRYGGSAQHKAAALGTYYAPQQAQQPAYQYGGQQPQAQAYQQPQAPQAQLQRTAPYASTYQSSNVAGNGVNSPIGAVGGAGGYYAGAAASSHILGSGNNNASNTDNDVYGRGARQSQPQSQPQQAQVLQHHPQAQQQQQGTPLYNGSPQDPRFSQKTIGFGSAVGGGNGSPYINNNDASFSSNSLYTAPTAGGNGASITMAASFNNSGTSTNAILGGGMQPFVPPPAPQQQQSRIIPLQQPMYQTYAPPVPQQTFPPQLQQQQQQQPPQHSEQQPRGPRQGERRRHGEPRPGGRGRGRQQVVHNSFLYNQQHHFSSNNAVPERTLTALIAHPDTRQRYHIKLNRIYATMVDVSAYRQRVSEGEIISDGGAPFVFCTDFLTVKGCPHGSGCNRVHIAGVDYAWVPISPERTTRPDGAEVYKPGFTINCYDETLSHYYQLPSELALVTAGSERFIRMYNEHGSNFKHKFILRRADSAVAYADLADSDDIHSTLSDISSASQTHVTDEERMSGVPRLDAGVTVRVYDQNSADTWHEYGGERVLMTQGASSYMRFYEAAGNQVPPRKRMQHCAHFRMKDMCRCGASCKFLHVLFTAEERAQRDKDRAAAAEAAAEAAAAGDSSS